MHAKSAEMRRQEITHGTADLDCVGLERKMTAVDEANIGGGHVSPVRLGARRQEEGVVPARSDQMALFRELKDQVAKTYGWQSETRAGAGWSAGQDRQPHGRRASGRRH